MHVDEDRLRSREQALRLALARMLDAEERYPGDLASARENARAELRRAPLWCELADEQDHHN